MQSSQCTYSTWSRGWNIDLKQYRQFASTTWSTMHCATAGEHAVLHGQVRWYSNRRICHLKNHSNSKWEASQKTTKENHHNQNKCPALFRTCQSITAWQMRTGLTKHITDQQLQEALHIGTHLPLPDWSSHSQSLDRAVKFTSEALHSVYEQDSRHKHSSYI